MPSKVRILHPPFRETGSEPRFSAEKAPRGVAQLGRALCSGRRGRRFKSCHPDLHGRSKGRPCAFLIAAGTAPPSPRFLEFGGVCLIAAGTAPPSPRFLEFGGVCLIAAGTAPPSPRCVDSAVAVGARYDLPLVLARRPHSRTLPPFLTYQWPPSGYH